jgi:hypothetical protein
VPESIACQAGHRPARSPAPCSRPAAQACPSAKPAGNPAMHGPVRTHLAEGQDVQFFAGSAYDGGEKINTIKFPTTDLMHALMQTSTIILHLHHQFKDGLIQRLINNVTWIDDMAQGGALIHPLKYKYPLTPSHSTHHKGSPHSLCQDVKVV